MPAMTGTNGLNAEFRRTLSTRRTEYGASDHTKCDERGEKDTEQGDSASGTGLVLKPFVGLTRLAVKSNRLGAPEARGRVRKHITARLH